MSSPYLQIALECRPLRIDGLEATTAPPSLATLQLGLAMLFAGMMLTLSVTLSLAATPSRSSGAAATTTDAIIHSAPAPEKLLHQA